MTILQRQCLLRYLGYDVAVDSMDGSQTRGAMERFCREYGSQELRKAVGQDWQRPKGDVWEDIRYFRRNEPFIGCACGACGGFPVEPEKNLMQLADRVREHFGAPMIPTSTVRCREHNAAVGGVANSRHLMGKAMDFKIPGKTSDQILAYVKKQEDVRYAYAVNSRVVHMDID